MTEVATAAPTWVRIAITSPEILAQIRQVFAGKNLAVEIIRAPYVEVMVQAAAPDRPARKPAGDPGSRQLRAAYRLNVVEVGDGARARRPDQEDSVSGPAVTLSRRQDEVMALVSQGIRNPEIAARLRVSEKTVKNHINRIFRALGAGSRVEAVLIWQRHQRSSATGRGAPRPPLTPVAGRRPTSAETP